MLNGDSDVMSIFGEPPAFDLACVGVSILDLNAMTVEAIRYMIHAKTVYRYPVSNRHLKLLSDLNSNVINLNEQQYRDGRERRVAYAEIIDQILDAAHTQGGVVYAQQGSPFFFCLYLNRGPTPRTAGRIEDSPYSGSVLIRVRNGRT